MSTVVQLKRTETAGSIPTAADIAVGELAVNLADGTLYSKRTDGAVIEIAGNLPDEYYLSTNQDYGAIDSIGQSTLDLGNLDQGSQQVNLGDVVVYVEIAVPPASANSSGEINQIAYDSNYLYVCVATNTWKRIALSSW
jgi:hypothetical protein